MHRLLSCIIMVVTSITLIGCASTGIQGADLSGAEEVTEQQKKKEEKHIDEKQEVKQEEVAKKKQDREQEEAKAALREVVGEALVALRHGKKDEFQKNWSLSNEIAKQLGFQKYEQKKIQKLEQENKKLRQKLARFEKEKSQLQEQLAEVQSEKQVVGEKVEQVKNQKDEWRERTLELKKENKQQRQKLAHTEQENKKLKQKNKSLREMLAPTNQEQKVTDNNNAPTAKKKKQEITDSSEVSQSNPQARLEVKGDYRPNNESAQLKTKVESLATENERLNQKVQELENRSKRAGPPWWMWLVVGGLSASVIVLLFLWRFLKRKLNTVKQKNERLHEKKEFSEMQIDALQIDNEKLNNELVDLRGWEEVEERIKEGENDNVRVVHPIFGDEEQLLRPG